MKRAIMILIFLRVSPILTIGFHFAARAQLFNDSFRWNIETVVSTGKDQDTSLALDSFGNPHITWQDQESRQLRYSTKSGNQWIIETIETGSNYESQIKIDGNDCPHVAYCAGNAKYATKQGETWSIEIIEEKIIGDGISLFLDQYGKPHVAYWDAASCCVDPQPDALIYAVKKGNEWVLERVSSGYVGQPSLFLDFSGNPHISYFSEQGDVVYAYKQNEEWSSEIVEHIEGWSFGKWLSRPSIFVDLENNPHISYQGRYSGNYALKYATKTTENWLIEVVDWAGWDTWTGYCSSLCLDDEGNPHISYNDGGPGKGGFVKYAVKRGGHWWKEVVDNTLWGVDSSLCFDSSGNPHIAYRISYWSGCGVRYGYSSECYPLNVILSGTARQPLPGNVLVLLINGETYVALNADANGEAHLEHVPVGMYTIEANYKGFSEAQNVSLNGPKDVFIELDIFIEILGVPLTFMQIVLLLSTIAIISVTTITVILLVKKREKGNRVRRESAQF